jgi:serine/threonine protein kinase
MLLEWYKSDQGRGYLSSPGPKNDITAYSAPEQIETGVATCAADVWSFGVVLWEIFTRQVPWKDLSRKELEKKIWIDKEELSFPPDCDSGIKKMIQDCWRIIPEERPTMEEICERISDLIRRLA